jgi:hypothetical protein
MGALMRAAAGAAAWSFAPASVSGYVADYDPSLITGLADGDPIPSCPDGSGNSRTASQATSSKRPSYKTGIFNGRPAMRFDGVDDYLLYDAGSSFYTSNVASFYIVHKPISIINNGRCLALWNGIANGDFNLPNVPVGSYGTSTQGDYRDGSLATVPQPSIGTASIFSDVYNGTSQQCWKNGTAGTGPVTGSPATGAFAFREFFLGAGYSAGITAYNNFDLARVLIYNAAHTTTERRYVEAGLGALYGITVV